MPIYETEKPTQTQIRVAVSVGGKLRQQYYHPKNPQDLEKARKQAKLLQDEWKFEANMLAYERNKKRKETGKSSAYVTGVSGIKMKFIVDIKHRPIRGAKTKRKRKICYYTPSFVVSGSHNKKLFCKQFNIKSLGYDMAWFKAVNFLCRTKGIYSTDDLQRRKPPVEQFAVVYKWQTKQGHDIPKERLPDEFLQKGSKSDLMRYLDA